MQEMVIYGVSFDLVGKQPIVLLKTADGNKFLPIWIGHPEAAAILMKLQGASTPRPMTHDLVTDMLVQLDAQVVRITVTELKENTFYASITVQQDGSEIEIDSGLGRHRARAAPRRRFAVDDVIESRRSSSRRRSERGEIVSEFKQFLENATPDELRRPRAKRRASAAPHRFARPSRRQVEDLAEDLVEAPPRAARDSRGSGS
jgi:hypothetical protein